MNVKDWGRSILRYRFAVVLTCIVFASPVYAEESDNFVIRLGAFLPAIDTSVRVDTANRGDDIDLENDTGLKSDLNVNRYELTYRFAERHRIQVARYAFSRSATRVIDTEIKVGDKVFPVNATLKTQFDNTFTELGYMYSFMKDKKSELTGTFGFHVMGTSLDFSTAAGGGITSDQKFTAPLPMLGVGYERSFSKKILMRANAQIFSLDVNGINGSIVDYRLAGEYLFTPMFGVGAGYHYFDMSIGLNKNLFDGKLKWQYQGVQLYAVMRF